MGIVVNEREIVEMKSINGVRRRRDLHGRQGAWVPSELFAGLLEVVAVEVNVPQRVDEFTRLKPGDLGHHHRQKGVTGDIEGNTEEEVGAALVELARQTIAGHVELKQQVAGRQCHLGHVRDVPSRNDQASRFGVGSNFVFHPRDLINRASVGLGPGPPLVPIHGAQVAVFVGPLVPDRDLVVLEPANVGVSSQEPQQFVDHGPDVDFFGGEKWESLGQVEPHLSTKQTTRSNAGTVFAIKAMTEDFVQKLQVCTHEIREF